MACRVCIIAWDCVSLSESTQQTDNGRIAPKGRGGLRNSSWKPGRSGNPSGRPRGDVDIAALARGHGPRCVKVVVDLLSSADEKIRLAAAVALLDRGFGRPKQEMDINSNSTIELHLVAARAISATLIEQQSTPTIETIESTSTDLPTE